MNIEDYRDYCLSLGDDIEEKFPFTKFKNGEGVLVFYVCGHMFSYFDCDEFKVISLKCQPERIEELKAEHDCIGSPFNESPKHWIGIDPNSASDELLKELTRNSYEIVKAKYTHFIIRPAKPDEAGLVLEFIKKLAAYEKCADEVVADEATVYHSLFVEHSAEVVFAEENGLVVGFALFFHNFSTFVGRKGLYLEDLFILPEKRGRGYGKALLKYLANLAVERNCGRMEWICLDWNESALKVYRSIGAIPMDEWTVQRLDEAALKRFAGKK